MIYLVDSIAKYTKFVSLMMHKQFIYSIQLNSISKFNQVDICITKSLGRLNKTYKIYKILYTSIIRQPLVVINFP